MLLLVYLFILSTSFIINSVSATRGKGKSNIVLVDLKITDFILLGNNLQFFTSYGRCNLKL